MQPDFFEKITGFFKKRGKESLQERQVLLACMGLSLLIWFFVKMSNSYESRGILLVNFKVPMGMVFSEPPLRSMPFKFSGTGWDLLKMALFRQQPSLEFNLSSSTQQVLSRSDISSEIEETLKLNLLELGQDNIALRLDSVFSKRVKIELDTDINYQNGYFVRDTISLSPDSITIFGATEVLGKMNAVKTELLSMNCPETDFSKTLEILNPKPGTLELSATQTKLFMPVEQYTEKVLTLPVTVLNAKDSIRLVPSSITLKCVVGISRYQEIKPSDFRVVAVIGNEQIGPSFTSTVPLTLVRQPSWVRSAVFTPKVVEYLIVQ